MNVSISKKILMTAIYFLIGHIINTFIETLLGYNGNGYTPLSIIVLSVVLCASSRHIRVGKLKSIHKGDDSQEKVVFNSNLKTKIQFVVKSKDFKVEVVIFVIVSAILILIPLLQTSFAYGFDAILASNPIGLNDSNIRL